MNAGSSWRMVSRAVSTCAQTVSPPAHQATARVQLMGLAPTAPAAAPRRFHGRRLVEDRRRRAPAPGRRRSPARPGTLRTDVERLGLGEHQGDIVRRRAGAVRACASTARSSTSGGTASKATPALRSSACGTGCRGEDDRLGHCHNALAWMARRLSASCRAAQRSRPPSPRSSGASRRSSASRGGRRAAARRLISSAIVARST